MELIPSDPAPPKLFKEIQSPYLLSNATKPSRLPALNVSFSPHLKEPK